MPTTTCPHCQRDVQFPDYFYGTEIGCPSPGCGKPVQLPNADGTMPAAPTGMVSAETSALPPADAYYLRKPFEPSVVVGPLPRERLRLMAAQGKLRPTDELSADRRDWRSAERRDPALFHTGVGVCRTCGATVADGGDVCPACAAADDGPAGKYGFAGGPALQVRALSARPERRFTAPRPLTDFAAAHAADAIVGASANGWLGLWGQLDDRPVRDWEFERGADLRLAVAARGGRAVLAVGGSRTTRVYIADFDRPRLQGAIEIDGPVRALDLDPAGEYLGLVDDGPDVRLFRIEPWKRMDRFPVRGGRFALSLAADRLAAADRDGEIALYDLRSGRVTRDLSAPRRQPALPKRPVRMAFDPTGRRLFAASGLTVRLPRESMSGINPNAAFWLGFAAGMATGVPLMGTTAAVVNDAVPDVYQNIRASRIADLMRDMCELTAVRVWEAAGGGLVANFWNVFEQHPTGLADAFYCPHGGVATVGETSVHGFDLDGGHHDLVYEVTDAGELHRARQVQPEGGSLIRRVGFTPDGQHALVLVAGDGHIRQVPWPVAAGDAV